MRQKILALAAAAAMVLSGCSGGGKALGVEGPGAAETQKEAESAGGESEVIEIEFRHALETQYEDTLNKVVEEFNNTHENIVVKPM